MLSDLVTKRGACSIATLHAPIHTVFPSHENISFSLTQPITLFHFIHSLDSYACILKTSGATAGTTPNQEKQKNFSYVISASFNSMCATYINLLHNLLLKWCIGKIEIFLFLTQIHHLCSELCAYLCKSHPGFISLVVNVR